MPHGGADVDHRDLVLESLPAEFLPLQVPLPVLLVDHLVFGALILVPHVDLHMGRERKKKHQHLGRKQELGMVGA